MEEKVVVCYAKDCGEKINPMLAKGWKVRLMVAENVSISVSAYSSSSSKESRQSGLIVFVLEKFT